MRSTDFGLLACLGQRTRGGIVELKMQMLGLYPRLQNRSQGMGLVLDI